MATSYYWLIGFVNSVASPFDEVGSALLPQWTSRFEAQDVAKTARVTNIRIAPALFMSLFEGRFIFIASFFLFCHGGFFDCCFWRLQSPLLTNTPDHVKPLKKFSKWKSRSVFMFGRDRKSLPPRNFSGEGRHVSCQVQFRQNPQRSLRDT